MITWHIGTKSSLSVDRKTKTCIDYKSEWYNGDKNGTQENYTIISAHSDGALSMYSIGGSEGFVYLYPEQVEHLREILRNMEGLKSTQREVL